MEDLRPRRVKCTCSPSHSGAASTVPRAPKPWPLNRPLKDSQGIHEKLYFYQNTCFNMSDELTVVNQAQKLKQTQKTFTKSMAIYVYSSTFNVEFASVKTTRSHIHDIVFLFLHICTFSKIYVNSFKPRSHIPYHNDWGKFEGRTDCVFPTVACRQSEQGSILSLTNV